jgi:hypothetical protein
MSLATSNSRGIWLDRKEAARHLKSLGWTVTPRTMEKWAANNNAGKGPAFTRFGWKTVKYLKEDLDAWSEARKARVG